MLPLDATCTRDIEEWAVVDESRMQRTDGAQDTLNEAIVAPSQSLRRFIEVVPCSNGRHFPNEVAIDLASPDWVFFKESRRVGGYLAPRVAEPHRYTCDTHLRLTTWH